MFIKKFIILGVIFLMLTPMIKSVIDITACPCSDSGNLTIQSIETDMENIKKMIMDSEKIEQILQKLGIEKSNIDINNIYIFKSDNFPNYILNDERVIIIPIKNSINYAALIVYFMKTQITDIFTLERKITKNGLSIVFNVQYGNNSHNIDTQKLYDLGGFQKIYQKLFSSQYLKEQNNSFIECVFVCFNFIFRIGPCWWWCGNCFINGNPLSCFFASICLIAIPAVCIIVCLLGFLPVKSI